MSETTEVIESTVEKVIQRIDGLADKLGIAAKEIWRFSVAAKAVEARRDLAKSAALLVVPLVLWGWSLHVALSAIPHDVESEMYQTFEQSVTLPCDQVATVDGKQTVLHEQCWNNAPKEKTRTTDKGISGVGWLLVASGFMGALVGLGIAGRAIAGVIDALAAAKKVEYDAYQDLISDWRD